MSSTREVDAGDVIGASPDPDDETEARGLECSAGSTPLAISSKASCKAT